MKSLIATLLIALSFQVHANGEQDSNEHKSEFTKDLAKSINERTYIQTIVNCVFSPDMKQLYRYSEERLKEFDFEKFEKAVYNTNPEKKTITFSEALMAIGYLEFVETGKVPAAKERCKVLDSLGLLPSDKEIQEKIEKVGIFMFFLKIL